MKTKLQEKFEETQLQLAVHQRGANTCRAQLQAHTAEIQRLLGRAQLLEELVREEAEAAKQAAPVAPKVPDAEVETPAPAAVPEAPAPTS